MWETVAAEWCRELPVCDRLPKRTKGKTGMGGREETSRTSTRCCMQSLRRRLLTLERASSSRPYQHDHEEATASRSSFCGYFSMPTVRRWYEPRRRPVYACLSSLTSSTTCLSSSVGKLSNEAARAGDDEEAGAAGIVGDGGGLECVCVRFSTAQRKDKSAGARGVKWCSERGSLAPLE